MAFLIKGILHHRGIINERPSRDGSKVFRSQEIILKQPRIDQWSGETLDGGNYIVFEAQNDIIDTLMGFNDGDVIEVEFFPRGTEYQDKAGELKWFSRLNIKSVKLIRSFAPQSTSAAAGQPASDGTDEDMPAWMR